MPSGHRYLYFCLFSSFLKKSVALSYRVKAISASFVAKQFNASANGSSDAESHDEEGQREQSEAYLEAKTYKIYEISILTQRVMILT